MKFFYKLILNNKIIRLQSPATVVFRFLTEQKLTGTKEGCREGDCGAVRYYRTNC